ncbi:hypothetical protein BN2476_350072 [Paraburkholderia piptadeniae]|uniref:Uncharacterized protein n=1 Tax=Paraburkholderia piptadeniae TaxID=1701573 RepID=A0A1N7S7S0_9BURK|nr:hypothetical protein BN2476_350072 [Paraburkholderia piptadeniae]
MPLVFRQRHAFEASAGAVHWPGASRADGLTLVIDWSLIRVTLRVTPKAVSLLCPTSPHPRSPSLNRPSRWSRPASVSFSTARTARPMRC